LREYKLLISLVSFQFKDEKELIFFIPICGPAKKNFARSNAALCLRKSLSKNEPIALRKFSRVKRHGLFQLRRSPRATRTKAGNNV